MDDSTNDKNRDDRCSTNMDVLEELDTLPLGLANRRGYQEGWMEREVEWTAASENNWHGEFHHFRRQLRHLVAIEQAIK